MSRVHSTCVFCDGGCALSVTTEEEGVTVRPLDPSNPAICSKAIRFEEIRSYENRLTQPLENIGKRGEPIWKEITWDEALDKIADRLKKIINEYGPESIAVSEMPLNHGLGGITRRFMNHIGTPNYITALDLCMGNTAQVHRATYGWFTSPKWEEADCIVYFGQNRGPELWPVEFGKLKAAIARGAKLIVIDPRETDTAKMADYHLRINYGTDAALALAWINVIIEEGLYDKEFVETSTIGFDELKIRAAEYTPEKVAEICGIDAELIKETARVYANSQMGIIPWGATCDMQRNSTSVLRSQCILRSICGFVNKSEMVFGPVSDLLPVSVIADFDALPQSQRDKQLGIEDYPLFSFKGGSLYEKRLKEVGIDYYPDILACSAMAHPTTTFAAMRGEGPYPVKAFFSVANNTVMSYANMPGIIDALMNQDLVVSFEVNMTPTAQLSDFVLPGNMWMERDVVGPMSDVAPAITTSFGFAEAPGECKDWYYVIKGLADRLGIGDAFPWADSHEFCGYRLEKAGLTWDAAKDVVAKPGTPTLCGQFLTPSGKIELASSVLKDLGYDPLPYYEPVHESDYDPAEYPYVIFAGAREAADYNTNLHQIQFLRDSLPEPELFIHPDDAAAEGVDNGDWVRVSTTFGTIELLVVVDEAQKKGSLRIPHGWWKPECLPGLDAGLSMSTSYNDGMLFTDEAWNLDPEQGLANIRGGIHAKIEAK